MTKSFDEWYFDLFESGNGSALNQQEIAEEAWDFRQAEVDELQKRIDEAIAILSSKKKMYVDMVIEVEKALKGGNK